jgi:hypothetical protein
MNARFAQWILRRRLSPRATVHRGRIPPCIADDFCTLMRMPQFEAAGSMDALDSGDSWAIFYSVRG